MSIMGDKMSDAVDINLLVKDLKRESGRTGVWNFYNPKNLYLTDAQGKAYLELMGDHRYASKFHDKTELLIAQHSEKIAKLILDKNVLIIDLGPGYPSKTFPIVDALLKAGKEIEYWAVDVNEHFGNIAKDAIKEKGVLRSYAKKMLFEDTPEQIVKTGIVSPKLAIIGLTFMNFESQYILKIIKGIVSGKKDACLSAIECQDNADINLLTEGYKTSSAKKLVFSPLALLGIDESKVDYKVDFYKQRIETGFVLHQVPLKLKNVGVKENDIIVTAISYRYKEDDYKKLLSSCFSNNEFCKLGNTILAISTNL